MPATSEKQKKFMDAVAHNPAFAKQTGVPQSVGKDFSEASKGMKFGNAPRTRADSQSINNPKTNQGKQELFKKGGNAMATKMNPGLMAMMAKKKDGMKKGGMSMAAFEKSGKDVEKKGVKEGSKADMAMDKKQMMMKKGGATKKMASGGSASARADGVATKGKTKGKMLAKGGKAYC
jgi:hypothetical protein